ncbi:L-threonylcarbamoyladenylate synthase [Rhodoferax sp.]|uniref:L-threonylcarbamoyladenylate synthase n=1 Tax=Rhodoferax sp. TaxID=50421 RepID=UPI002601F748|nr:L-threonylcarbamoyladenylate synthase [Rhodoferax sp.]MDD2917365.1 L-threonylcarbamoyladenylate synthase [Rhodoferax sp.]
MILPGHIPESIAQAAHCIRAGGLLGLPTETVYGLAANADDDAAVAQIFKAKGRPADHPLIVHVADASAVAHYASEVPEFARQLMAAFWPGPLTLILPRRSGVANAAAGGNPTIGLRCPSHPVAQALLKALMDCRATLAMTANSSEPVIARSEATRQSMPLCVWGLAAPSANQFGRVSPTTAAHVQGEFGDDLLILDGSACRVGIESTIIDCTRGQPVLLRPGAITPQQVQAVCGLRVVSKDEALAQETPAPKASGTLESHYAPKARVRLMTAQALQTSLDLLGADIAGKASKGGYLVATYSRAILKTANAQVLCRRMPDDAAATAQQLFAVLRAFDAQGVKLIWIESPPASPDWDGVRDRLQRASAA